MDQIWELHWPTSEYMNHSLQMWQLILLRTNCTRSMLWLAPGRVNVQMKLTQQQSRPTTYLSLHRCRSIHSHCPKRRLTRSRHPWSSKVGRWSFRIQSRSTIEDRLRKPSLEQILRILNHIDFNPDPSESNQIHQRNWVYGIVGLSFSVIVESWQLL